MQFSERERQTPADWLNLPAVGSTSVSAIVDSLAPAVIGLQEKKGPPSKHGMLPTNCVRRSLAKAPARKGKEGKAERRKEGRKAGPFPSFSFSFVFFFFLGAVD